ncbi:MAG: hypothetical protein IT348_03100 [Candidatus Eisenbacteria bacterium]|nr:hypothetical protein [Candidatus Eisenbacteria bacterium]
MPEKKPSTRSRTKSSAGPSKAGDGAPAAPRRAAAARAVAPTGGLALLDAAFAGRFPTTLWIEGADESLKAAFLAELRRAWAIAVPDAPIARVLWVRENGVDEIMAAYHNVSMFAPRELTIVFDVEDLLRSEKRVAVLAEGMSRPAGESCLVLVESAADKERAKLAPARAAAAARWDAEPPDSRTLLAWGQRRLEREKLADELGALEALLTACEGDTTTFFNELGKLCAWCAAAGKVTRADVAELSRPIVGAELDEYLASVARGDVAMAAKRLGRILAEGESEGGIMFALANLVGGALGGWARWRDMSQALGRRKDPRALARALDAIYRAESAWKGGRTDVRLALEMATREVAGA